MKISSISLFLLFFCSNPSKLAGQISLVYPNDIGIESDSNVLYVEKFEDGLPGIFSRYQDKKNTAGMSLDTDVPPGSTGLYSLKMTNLGGSNSGGHLYKQFAPGWDSTVYIRYYVKYPSISQGYIHHEAVWFGGYNPATPWPNPQAGTCGLGDQRISIAYEPVSNTNMNTYLYWGEMHQDPNGNCWGNVMIRGDSMPALVPYDDWLCVEVMVKLNNPVTASNGELQIWHNGKEVGHWGPGFPNGSWTWDKFNIDPSAPAFPGFRWRTDPKLNINYLWIEYYDDQSPNGVSHYIKYDHLVVAQKRIGPIYQLSEVNTPLSSVPFVQFSPNPAVDFINLRFQEHNPEAHIRLYDMLGNLILTRMESSADPKLDVSSLKTGVYLLEVCTPTKGFRRQIIKA